MTHLASRSLFPKIDDSVATAAASSAPAAAFAAATAFAPARAVRRHGLLALFVLVALLSPPTTSAAPLSYPSQINESNPNAEKVTKARKAYVDSYKKIWADYYKRPWDYGLYVRNYNAYVRAWYSYQWSLYDYYRWEYDNRRSFSGRVLTTAIVPVPRPLDANASRSSSSIMAPTRPLSGATVLLVSDIRYIQDPGPGGIPRYETRTNANGEFLLRNLKVGRYRYTVSRAGYQNDTGSVTIHEEPVRRTFVLGKTEVRFLEGNVYYVEPGWLPTPLRNRISSGEMNSDTAAELADLVERPTSSSNLLPSRLIPVDDQTVTLTRTDPVIQIYPPRPVESHRAVTNSAGNFRIDDLRGEGYRIDLKRSGFHSYTRDIELTDGANRVTVILVRIYNGFDDLYFTEDP